MTTAAKTERQNAAPKQQRDFRQEVTDQIVGMLEQGVAPWQKPWEPGAGSLGVPVNPTTERSYRGGNAIHLIATALKHEYDDPRWMTYSQAAKEGWQVRRGEKGTQIEFWDIQQPAKAEPGGEGEGAASPQNPRENSDANRPRYIHRVYTVFNGGQIDGIPPLAPKTHTAFEAAQAGEEILKNSGATIRHDQQDQAFYNRATDSIHLPPKDQFKDAPGYYGTVLHELAHWSGHPDRLNRATLNDAYRFGDTNYAKEELRAELASVFLAAERGIPHNPQQHAAYVGDWIKALKGDKNEIFRAAHDASAATDFLLALERDKSRADQTLAAGPQASTITGSSVAATLEDQTTEMNRNRDQTEEFATHELSQDEHIVAYNKNYKGAPGTGLVVSAEADSAGQLAISVSADLADGSATDRRDTLELQGTPSRKGAGELDTRESASHVVRPEPGSSTVNVHHKETGADRHTPGPQQAAPAESMNGGPGDSSEDKLREAQSVAAQALGKSVKIQLPEQESGIYRGRIIGVTDTYAIQRLSARTAVAHPKQLLESQPEIGANVSVSYSNYFGATVREVPERSKGRDLSR